MTATRYNPTARTQLSRLRRDLDGLRARAEALDQSEELASDLNRYFCVRVSGYLEQALAYCGRSISARAAWGQAQTFALSWLNRPPNPRADEVIRFVQRFDEAWAQELKDLLARDERGQSINALLGIRNDIAHGRNQGVSLVRAVEYLSIVDEIVEFLLERFEPRP